MGDALNNERFGFESDLHIGIEIVGTKFSSTSIRVKRDWKMQLKEQQDNVDIKKQLSNRLEILALLMVMGSLKQSHIM